MAKLVANENMKIYRRVRTWILLGLLVLAAVLAPVLQKNLMKAPDRDWKAQVTQEIQMHKDILNEQVPDVVKKDAQKRIQVGEYRLAHDIPPADRTIWGGVLDSAPLISIITIFTVIIAADIVAGEFATGTVKLLLIRPASRAKILLSKYLATFLFTIFMLAVLFVVSYVTNGLLYGFEGSSLPYVFMAGDGTVQERSMLLQSLFTYGLECVSLLLIVTMAFMISTVFRSSAMSIGISLAVMFLGSSLSMLFSRYWWGKYYLFMNTNLSVYIDGMPPMAGMTLGFSAAVLLVYFVIFNLLSWTIFIKRDVAA